MGYYPPPGAGPGYPPPGGGPGFHPYGVGPGTPPPGGGPGFPPPGAGPGFQPPTGPPPAFTPQPQAAPLAVSPGGLRGCLFRFTYVWLVNGRQFWFFPVRVERFSVAGFRWTGFSWMFFGIDLRFIRSYTCF